MTEGCHEKLDMTFIRWIWNFPKVSRPKLLARVDQFGKNAKLITLKNHRDIESFLAT